MKTLVGVHRDANFGTAGDTSIKGAFPWDVKKKIPVQEDVGNIGLKGNKCERN